MRKKISWILAIFVLVANILLSFVNYVSAAETREVNANIYLDAPEGYSVTFRYLANGEPMAYETLYPGDNSFSFQAVWGEDEITFDPIETVVEFEIYSPVDAEFDTTNYRLDIDDDYMEVWNDRIEITNPSAIPADWNWRLAAKRELATINFVDEDWVTELFDPITANVGDDIWLMYPWEPEKKENGRVFAYWDPNFPDTMPEWWATLQAVFRSGTLQKDIHAELYFDAPEGCTWEWGYQIDAIDMYRQTLIPWANVFDFTLYWWWDEADGHDMQLGRRSENLYCTWKIFSEETDLGLPTDYDIFHDSIVVNLGGLNENIRSFPENRVWTIKTKAIPLNVEFDLNWWKCGNDDTIPTQTVSFGDYATAPTCEMNKEWYTFHGWYVNAETQWDQFSFENMVIEENMMLYARWDEAQQETGGNNGWGTNGGWSNWWGSSGWWAWDKPKIDDCPNGDYSSSYYDWTCGMPENNAENNGETGGEESINDNKDSLQVQNDEEKWQLDEELKSAYERAYENWITTISGFALADPDWYVKRWHMAKMVVNFVVNVLGYSEPTEIPEICKTRNDEQTVRESQEIRNYADRSCALWIMWIDMEDNKFLPNDIVSRAEFGTIVSRILYWDVYNVKHTVEHPYYENHLKVLKDNWFMTQIDSPLTRKELRKRVWVIFKRVSSL